MNNHAGVQLNAARAALDLPRLLRLTGSAVLVLSLSSFLFQDWGAVGDLERFGLLLAQTLLLVGAGFACIRLLAEPKGARTFLALAVAAVPVNVTVLGALLHSVWGGAAPVAAPQAALWQAADAGVLAATAALAAVVLAGVTRFGFLVLVRGSAARLTGLYLLGNLLLLLPSRDPLWVAPAAVALMLLLGRQLHRAQTADPGLRTAEGWVVRLALWVPVGILLGRNLLLYPSHPLTVTAAAGVSFLFLRALSVPLREGTLRRLLEVSSLLPAAVAALGSAELVAQWSAAGDGLVLDAATLVLALFAYDLGARSPDAAGYRRLATVVLAGGLLTSLAGFGGHWTALVCLAAGAALLVGGVRLRQRSLFVGGALLLAGGVAYAVTRVFAGFDFGHWGTLAAAGAASVVLASLLERHGARLKAASGRWRQAFGDWSA